MRLYILRYVSRYRYQYNVFVNLTFTYIRWPTLFCLKVCFITKIFSCCNWLENYLKKSKYRKSMVGHPTVPSHKNVINVA